MNLYGIQNRNTIGKEVFCGSVHDAIIDKILEGTEFHHATTIQGYVNVGKCSILEYEGKFGKGFVILDKSWNPYTQKPSNKYIDMSYYIRGQK